MMGLGATSAADPKFLGMLGMHGTYEANMTMQHCDVLIAVGARYVKLSACMFIDMADAKIDMARMMREQCGKGSTRSD